jgi:hypothetical protein
MTHVQRLEYQREYYRTHKEQYKAYAKKVQKKRQAYNRKYYRENKWKWEEFYIPRAIVKAAKKQEAQNDNPASMR